MWIADNWKDYEIIDCSKGEKLERWGKYLLVRPDPQVIWDTPKTDRGWKNMNGHYHRSKKGGGEWEFFKLPQQWQIHYGSLTFNLKPFSFKHTGLFPEQATNWDWFSEKIRNAGRPVKVLNLFAYTGGATLAAAAAGATVTHVDASKGMVTWAKENATPTNESMLSVSEATEENQKKPNAYMVEKQLAEVEAEIARLEATMKMYEVQLANPVVQQDLDEMSKISIQIEETQTELDSLYEKWERLCE